MENFNLSGPANDAVSVTPSDSTSLLVTGRNAIESAPRGLYIGVSGDVAVQTLNGTTITFTSVPVGILPIRVAKVMETNTDAEEILALY